MGKRKFKIKGGKMLERVRTYKTRPIFKKALRFDGTAEGVGEVKKFVGKNCGEEVIVLGTNLYPKYGFSKDYKGQIFKIIIKTLEGDHQASPGDYIIQGLSGEFYPCKPDIFKKTYEEVKNDKT